MICSLLTGTRSDLGGDDGLNLCTLFFLALEYWGSVSGQVFEALERCLAAGLGDRVGAMGPATEVGVELLPWL